MVLPIDKAIDLTLYENNPAPKLVQSLSIIHEAEQGEIVQYYIEPESKLQGDKNSYAEAKYNKDTDSYDYYDYDEITWGTPRRRIATRKMDHLGLKAFPGVGAIAFYKLAYQVWSKIVAPVNNPKRLYPSPIVTMTASALSLHFELSPPSDKVTYICYRITLRSGEYAEEYITYDTSFDCGMPKMNGEYEAYAQGYIEEGEEASELSPSVFFTCNVPGQSSDKPVTTEGSDIFIAGLRFTQDNKLLATLTNGHNVNSINKVPTPGRIACELLLSNWEEIEGHWEQTVIDSSIKDDDIFGEMYVEFTGSPQIDTLNNASLGCIAGAITSNGSITFYCYGNKPNANVTIYANRG